VDEIETKLVNFWAKAIVKGKDSVETAILGTLRETMGQDFVQKVLDLVDAIEKG
jgi:hypothetical protein